MRCLQSGMRETDAPEIELHEVEGPVLNLLVLYMYGKLAKIPDCYLLPLFLAADAHQVTHPLCNCNIAQVIGIKVQRASFTEHS